MPEIYLTEILSRTELFMGLPDENLIQIKDLPSCVVRHYSPGDYIFEKGEAANDLMVIVRGRANIVAETMPTGPDTEEVQRNSRRVERITTGGTIGVSALIPPYRRGLSAIADTDAEVLSINAKELMELFEREPRIGYEVLRSLVRVFGSKILNIENMIVRD